MMTRNVRALSVVLLLALTACSPDPTARWAQQRETLTATQDAILRQHAAGTLPDQALLVADPAIQAARAALDAAQEQLPDGPDAHTYLDAAGRALQAAAAAGAARVRP